MKAMASPACTSLVLLVLVCISLCSAHRLLQVSTSVRTRESEPIRRIKNGEPELLPPHYPFQGELLPPHHPLLTPRHSPFEGELLPPHHPYSKRSYYLSINPLHRGDYVELPPHNPFQEELLHPHKPGVGENSVKNGEPKPPGNDLAHTDTEFGASEPPDYD